MTVPNGKNCRDWTIRSRMPKLRYDEKHGIYSENAK